MRYSRALIRVVLLAAVLAGCGGSAGSGTSDTTAIGPNGEILLVNPHSAGENYEMEAAFEGTLVLSEDDCVTGMTDDGLAVGVVFPAGTHFGTGTTLTVEVEGHAIQIGTHVTFGGGYLTAKDVEKLLGGATDACHRDESFYVQTVS